MDVHPRVTRITVDHMVYAQQATKDRGSSQSRTPKKEWPGLRSTLGGMPHSYRSLVPHRYVHKEGASEARLLSPPWLILQAARAQEEHLLASGHYGKG
jgi:hypothetical protein